MRSSHWTIVAAAGVLLALSGCTPGAEGGPTSTASPRPTASSSPTAVTTPAPACADLADPGVITALVGGSGTPQKFEHLQPGGIYGDAAWSIWTANGAVCGWGERGADQSIEQPMPGTVLLQVVPGLESAWNALAQESSPSAGSPYDGGVSLGGHCDRGLCLTDVLVDGAWLHVQAEGESALGESAFHGFVQGVVTRYRALPAPTVRQPHPRSCDDPALQSAVKSVFGDGDLVGPDGSPQFVLTDALARAGYLTACRFDSSSGAKGWETFVTVLDDAPPSLVAAYRSGTDHPDSRPVDVSALGSDASGLYEPTVDSERTIVDVADGGRWLQIETYNTDDTAKTVNLAQKLLASSWVK